MDNRLSRDDPKYRGSSLTAPKDVARLYRHAFSKFGTRALRNWGRLDKLMIIQALTIAEYVKFDGNLGVRQVAKHIEQACLAAFSSVNRDPSRAGAAVLPGELCRRFDNNGDRNTTRAKKC